MDSRAAIDPRVQEILHETEPEVGTDRNITLSSGVVLKAKRFPPLLITQIQRKFKTPPPPKVADTERGGTIENPNDPAYMQRLQELEQERGMAFLDIALARGTEVVFIPEGIPAVEDETWRQEVEDLLGEEVPESGTSRYLAWLKYVVILDQSEIEMLSGRLTALMGVTQEAVSDALDGFPDNNRGPSA